MLKSYIYLQNPAWVFRGNVVSHMDDSMPMCRSNSQDTRFGLRTIYKCFENPDFLLSILPKSSFGEHKVGKMQKIVATCDVLTSLLVFLGCLWVFLELLVFLEFLVLHQNITWRNPSASFDASYRVDTLATVGGSV
jgi:hypothetical protein